MRPIEGAEALFRGLELENEPFEASHMAPWVRFEDVRRFQRLGSPQGRR